MTNQNSPEQTNKSFVEEVFREFQRTNTPPEWRASLRIIVAALLAASLWIILGWLALEQFKTSREFAQMLVEAEPEDKEKIELIKQAAAQVDNTANSLYALLGPIVTAVTGYFFVAAGAPRSLDGGSQPPSEEPNGASNHPEAKT